MEKNNPKPQPPPATGAQAAWLPSVVNKDGSLNIHRAPTGRLITDLYHRLLSVSWPRFFTFVIAIYFLTNLLFALLYYSCGENALIGIGKHPLARFEDCYFFSVQTLATIGYGHLAPSGFWPNVLVTIEAFLGMMTLAVTTGLLFARFSRPTARVLFSNKAIIGEHNGRLNFIFRTANERLNKIAEAHITLSFSQVEVSKEGETSRKFYDLKLERNYTPLFAMTWTVRHPIDADSPLFGMDENTLRQKEVVIIASLTGLDETFSQTITARQVYTADDIVYNRRFKDIISRHGQKIHVDLKSIHEMH